MATITRTEVEQAVDNGFELLTTRLGEGWWDNVDCDRLDLECPCACVLGQLAELLTGRDGFTPRYGRAARALGLDPTLDSADPYCLPTTYGFTLESNRKEDWDETEQEWVRRIREAQEASA